MQAGLIINPAAGKSAQLMTDLLQRMENTWGQHQWLVPDFIDAKHFPKARRITPKETGYIQRIYSLVQQMTEGPLDYLVSVGGDGTAAYIAEALISLGRSVPILGIGLGTANVGPIVTFGGTEVLPPLEALSTTAVGCVGAYQQGKRIAGGFNDLVLGNTYLATINGNTVTASAEALFRSGVVEEAEAMTQIFTESTRITKNGQPCPYHLPQVGQAVLSTLERRDYYGHAVDGILCYSPEAPEQAALTLSGRVLVAFTEDNRGYQEFSPEDRLLFGADDTLVVEHLQPGVNIIADGNPYALSASPVTFRYEPQIIRVARR